MIACDPSASLIPSEPLQAYVFADSCVSTTEACAFECIDGSVYDAVSGECEFPGCTEQNVLETCTLYADDPCTVPVCNE